VPGATSIVDNSDVETRELRMVLSDVDNARAFANLAVSTHEAFRLYKQNMHYPRYACTTHAMRHLN
jgi:hypothetical protein